MLKNLHLVGENEDDDLYSEFKEVDNEELIADEGFQQALKTSYGNRPVPGTRGGGANHAIGTSARICWGARNSHGWCSGCRCQPSKTNDCC